MQEFFTELIVKLLRQGHSIEAIESAMMDELEIIQQSKPFMMAQKESDKAP
jgi:hypothetical protein